MLLWIIVSLMYETLADGPIDVWGALVPHLVVAGVFLLGAYVTIAFGFHNAGNDPVWWVS